APARRQRRAALGQAAARVHGRLPHLRDVPVAQLRADPVPAAGAVLRLRPLRPACRGPGTTGRCAAGTLGRGHAAGHPRHHRHDLRGGARAERPRAMNRTIARTASTARPAATGARPRPATAPRRIALVTPILPVPHDQTRGRYIHETARALSKLATVRVFFQQPRYPDVPGLAPRSFLAGHVGPDYRLD